MIWWRKSDVYFSITKRFYKPFEGIGIFSSCFSPNLNVIWEDYGLLLVILCLEAQMKNKCICGVCVCLCVSRFIQ